MTFEEHIQRGFNAGYELEKLSPELSKTIKDGFTEKEHPYVQGFMAGSQEYVKENTRSNSPLIGKYLAGKNQEKEPPAPSLEKDEPEIEM